MISCCFLLQWCNRFKLFLHRLHFRFGDIRGSFQWKRSKTTALSQRDPQKSGHLNIKKSPPSHKEVRASCVAASFVNLEPQKYNQVFVFFSPCALFTKAIMHHKRKGRCYLTSRSFSRFSSGLWRELDMAYETSFPLWGLSWLLQQLIGRFVLSLVSQTVIVLFLKKKVWGFIVWLGLSVPIRQVINSYSFTFSTSHDWFNCHPKKLFSHHHNSLDWFFCLLII